jgi:type IV secretory pathway VirB10-like protein
MNRLLRYLSLLMAVVLIFTLIGCSSTSVTSQNIELEVKQEVEESETEVNSVIVSKTSEEHEIKTESSSNDDVELIAAEEVSSKTKKEQSSTVTAVETKKEEVPSKKETEKTETVAKTDKENLSKTTSTKEETQKDTKTTAVKATTEATKQTETKPTVSIMIIGPKDFGVILPKTKVTLSEGDTVLDVLLKAAKKKNLLVEHSGSGAMAYIEGIDNIYEFDYGAKSGWNFKLNGITISKSSGIVKVKKDDRIEWSYSEDFTEDNE